MSQASVDSAIGQVVADLLRRSHLLMPMAVAEAIADAAKPIGVSEARIYLADLEQQWLRPLPDGTGQHADALAMDSTLAGRAYRTIRVQHAAQEGGTGRHRLAIPLVDGSERLGVLELVVADIAEPMLAAYRTLASLTGLMIVSKGSYSDGYPQARRSREMALQAELVWAFLAPRTFATERCLITAALEPAYDVGGDAFDYSLIGDRLHVSIFDAAGHDLAAGLLASVAMASCRSTRRAGGPLTEIVSRADHAIARQFGESRFVTGLLCDLDVRTGQFCWIPCGHPPPVLIRGNKMVRELTARPQLPLGIAEIDVLTASGTLTGDPYDEQAASVYTEQLDAGDRLLLYTDGVTDGRAADGSPFGVQRLTDFVVRHAEAGLPASETLRRLNRAITAYQHGRLADDATTVLIEWMPADPAELIP
jgi:serine phosphatase RsbU (regulator of sigma subunit)